MEVAERVFAAIAIAEALRYTQDVVFRGTAIGAPQPQIGSHASPQTVGSSQEYWNTDALRVAAAESRSRRSSRAIAGVRNGNSAGASNAPDPLFANLVMEVTTSLR